MGKSADITRRTMLVTAAAAGAGFAIWPYRSRNVRDIPSGRVVLNYWEKWTGVEGQALGRIVDRFNNSQNRIWVKRVTMSDIVAKSMVAIGGGDPPDLVGLFNFNIPQFAEAGAILPLDELDSTKQLLPNHYAPAVWNLLTYENKMWAGVSTCYSLAVYYNREHFREVGLDPDSPPLTVTEFDHFAKLLTQFADDGSLKRAGFMPNIPNWWPHFWPAMFGGTFYDKQTNRATLVSPENIAAYEWVAKHPKLYGKMAAQTFASSFNRTFHSPQDPFLLGKVSMILQGPWIANFIGTYAPTFDYGCFSAPVVEELYDPTHPTGILEADVIMIPRGCPNPQAAFEFLLYTQRQDVQEQLATDHSKPSPLMNVSEKFIHEHPNRYVHVHDAIIKSDAVRVAPQTRVWKQYADMIASAFDAIWAGADVRSQLQAAQDRVQQLLDTSALRRQQRRDMIGKYP